MAGLPVSPVNASMVASRQPPHYSGSAWFARPSLYRTFIDYLLPVCTVALHVTACTLALSSYFVTRFTEGFNRFVTSTIAPVASGWSGCRAGLTLAGKRHLFTAHTRFSHWRASNVLLLTLDSGRLMGVCYCLANSDDPKPIRENINCPQHTTPHFPDTTSLHALRE
jgi:hypothetical protein